MPREVFLFLVYYKMAALKSLQENASNDVCVDCDRPGCRWASVNNGVLLCLRCFEEHKTLGSNVSFVRSLSVDSWSATQLRYMELGGNQRFKEMLARYKIVGVSLRDKYTNPAVKWYRAMLRAEVDGTVPPAPPPPAEVQAYVRAHQVPIKPTAQPQEEQKEESAGTWFGGFVNKASSWTKASIGEAGASLRSSAGHLYDKSKDVGLSLIEQSKDVGATVVQRSKDAGSSLVDRSWEVGSGLVSASKDLSANLVDKSLEVSSSVMHTSKDIGTALIGRSVEVTQSIFTRSASLTKGKARERSVGPAPRTKGRTWSTNSD